MTRSRLPALLLLPLLATAAACTDDPMERPGTYQVRGVNDANLRAMVANPADLQRGQEALTSRGAAAAEPVNLLRAGKRPPLSAPQKSGIQINTGGGGQDGAN